MFTLSKEQLDIQKAAREFAEGEFRPVARELDEASRFDERLWEKAAELGFLGVFLPEKYEGLGLGYVEQCLILEEFARVDMGICHAIEATFFGTQLLDLVGTPEQKQTYLPAICTGRMKMGMAITEPDAGSDVSAVSTEARREGDDYVINGSKVFITIAAARIFWWFCVSPIPVTRKCTSASAPSSWKPTGLDTKPALIMASCPCAVPKLETSFLKTCVYR